MKNSINSKNIVSIVIPTYNRDEKFLKRAIESLINQTYKNIEIIIIDDNKPGSEYSKQIVEYISRKYGQLDFIKYYKNDYNMGGALARNEGVKLSKGNYITFLDDDDKYLKNKISNQVEFMEKNSLDMSFSNLVIKDENNKIIDYREFSNIKNFDKNSLLKYHLKYHITGTPTFMYKKSSFNKIKGFDNVLVGQEFFLMLKTIESNMKINYLNSDDVISYAHSGERISVGKNKIIGEKYLLNYKKKYFEKLSFTEIRYIYFRHNAVLALSGLRDRNYKLLLTSSLKGFFYSPYYSMKEIINHFKKIRNKRNF